MPKSLVVAFLEFHVDPLDLLEAVFQERSLVRLGGPEVVVKLRVAALHREVDMQRIALFDRRFIRGVRNRVLVRLGEGRLVGDERAGVDANELASRLKQFISTLHKCVHHLLRGRIVEEEGGRDHIKARSKLLDESRLAGVGTAVLDLLRRVWVFLVLRQLDHVLRDVDADDGARCQITQLPGVKALTTGQVADAFVTEVASDQFHEGWSLRLSPERKHLGLLVLFCDLHILVFPSGLLD